MELFSKQNSEVRRSLDEYINQRWKQLYELEKEWGERAIRYLLLTNSGGAVATLSFLGASPTALNLLGAKVSLALFVAGILFVGISVAKAFHHMSWLYKEWKTDVEKYHSDKVTWEHLVGEDKKRAVDDFWDYVFPYASFGCFIAGCIAGAFALFS